MSSLLEFFGIAIQNAKNDFTLCHIMLKIYFLNGLTHKISANLLMEKLLMCDYDLELFLFALSFYLILDPGSSLSGPDSSSREQDPRQHLARMFSQTKGWCSAGIPIIDLPV